MFLLVGLGNYGKEYEKTRHNFGFLALDQIIADYNLNPATAKFSSEVFNGEISGQKIIAIKPQTYMNLSGKAVLAASSFYKILPQNIIIFHDDLDLKLGKIKVKIGGGNGGHNGLKNIDEKIGKNYLRVRLGIDKPQNKEFAVADYVLSKFSKEEIKIIEDINIKISKLLPELLKDDVNGFLNKFAL